MTGRRTLVAAQLALLAAALVAFALLGPTAADHDSTSTAGTAGSSAGETPHTDRPPSDGASTAPGATTPGNATPKNTVTNGKGSEVIKQPAGATRTGLPGLTPGKDTNVALIRGPLPRTASIRGAVVTGFPLAVVPVAPGSTVASSGVSSTRTALQVSLQAVTGQSPARVLAFYRSALTGSGFVESALPAVGGSSAAAFTHNADHLVVTVRSSRSKGSTYSVYGTLHTGKTP